jgi:hypothetical protein
MAENSKATKPYAVEFEHRDGYLYAHAMAERDSVDTSIAYWTDIATYCIAKGFSKLLVERDCGTCNSLDETFEVVSKVNEVGLSDIKIAFIDRRPDHMEPDLFGETIALNRGVICKVLKNFKEAEEWLLAS